MDARCRDPSNALSRPWSCGQSWSWVPVVQTFAEPGRKIEEDQRRSKRQTSPAGGGRQLAEAARKWRVAHLHVDVEWKIEQDRWLARRQ